MRKNMHVHIYSDQNMITSIPDIYANRGIPLLQTVLLRLTIRQAMCRAYAH